MTYKYLKHTADVKFLATGKTLASAFISSAYATIDIVTNHKKVKGLVEHKISIKSEDTKSLLYDFLEKIIVLIDTDGFLLHEVKDLQISENTLNCVFVGDKNNDSYMIDKAVKAVTYQEMEIKKEKNIYLIQCVIDI